MYCLCHRLSGMVTLPHVRVVCCCLWSVWIARALGCSQLWDAHPNPRGALGARPHGSGPPLLSIRPRCSLWPRAGRGEGPQRERSPHRRAPCSVKTQRVGSRPCHSSEALSEPNRSRWGVDSTGSPGEIASGYSIRKWPRGGAFHMWSHCIPGAGTVARAPLCRRGNGGLERAGPWPRMT